MEQDNGLLQNLSCYHCGWLLSESFTYLHCLNFYDFLNVTVAWSGFVGRVL